MAKNYLSVVYDDKSHPYTDYPKQLCAYLFQSFGLKKGMKMLEPGCGRGEFLNNFKEMGLDVVGVDISPDTSTCRSGSSCFVVVVVVTVLEIFFTISGVSTASSAQSSRPPSPQGMFLFSTK